MKTKYLRENFEPIVKNSKNYTEILQKLGLGIKGNSRPTLKKYIKLYDIDISHFESKVERYMRTNTKLNNSRKISTIEILVSGSTYTNLGNIKNRLYEEGLKKRICEKCGQNENWNGEHISLILDHINGDNSDHRIENLRILCPNCNATLPTHCRKKS
jgi:hypothetical protein